MAHDIPDDIFKATTQAQKGMRSILIITDDKTEDTEFFYPYYRFIEEGFNVAVATPDGGEFKGKNGSGLKETMKIEDIVATDYDLLYIPGGKAPAKLKKDEETVTLVKTFAALKKPIAAICHGPQLLAEAGVISGRTISAWPEVEEEVTEAGATYVSHEAITDGQFTTGRWPGDLPAFVAETLKVLNKGLSKNAGTTMASRSAA